MKARGKTNDIGWVKNILTWAMLGIAAYQFSSLTGKVEKVHELVITHDTKLQNYKEEIDRLREAIEFKRTELSARQ